MVEFSTYRATYTINDDDPPLTVNVTAPTAINRNTREESPLLLDWGLKKADTSDESGQRHPYGIISVFGFPNNPVNDASFTVRPIDAGEVVLEIIVADAIDQDGEYHRSLATVAEITFIVKPHRDLLLTGGSYEIPGREPDPPEVFEHPFDAIESIGSAPLNSKGGDNEEPFVIDEIVYKDYTLQARQPIILPVTRERDNEGEEYLCLQYPLLGAVCARNRFSFLNEVRAALDVAWRNYAMEDDDALLTSDALSLANQLRGAFIYVPHVTEPVDPELLPIMLNLVRGKGFALHARGTLILEPIRHEGGFMAIDHPIIGVIRAIDRDDLIETIQTAICDDWSAYVMPDEDLTEDLTTEEGAIAEFYRQTFEYVPHEPKPVEHVGEERAALGDALAQRYATEDGPEIDAGDAPEAASPGALEL